MAGFKLNVFRGIRPRISALKIAPGEAQTAENVRLGSGDIEAWNVPLLNTAVQNPTFNKTIYQFENDGSPVWFEWDNYVDVARGAVKGDVIERTYYTGDGKPKMTYIPIATDGAQPYPSTSRCLGIPAPTQPLTAVGPDLPEELPASARFASSLKSEYLDVDRVEWTVYTSPEAADEWSQELGGVGRLIFDVDTGTTFRVSEVIDPDNIKLESSANPAYAVRTYNSDKTTVYDWNAFSLTTTTHLADFLGWRSPAMTAYIPGHLLRVGDVLRATNVVTLNTSWAFGFDVDEVNWDAEVTIDGTTFVENARVQPSTLQPFDILGSFFYEIERAASDVSSLEDRSYVYTFVSSLGEEGPPSPVSATIPALDGDPVQLSGMEAPPALPEYDITAIRIYRTNSTSAGTEFQFVREITVATTATDTTTDANLGEILATSTWDPPPAGLQGLTAMPGGMMVGFVGKTLHFCEPYFPHAYPPEYDQAIDFNIVGLANIGNTVVVLTDGWPYILSGSHPRNVNPRPFKVNQACLSKEGIAKLNDRVIYPSPDGLIEIGVNGLRMITDSYVKKADWAAFSPETMVAEIHDGQYIAFFGGPAAVPQPTASIAVSGTLATADELDVRTGGETIILELTGDTWVSTGGPFEAQRQAIINGITSAQSETLGWNNEVRPNIPVTDVVRTGATTVTITLTAQPSYDTTANEVLSVMVPAAALTTSTSAVAGDVTITVDTLDGFGSAASAFMWRPAVPASSSVLNSYNDPDSWLSQYPFPSGALMNPSTAAYSPSLNRWVLGANERAGFKSYPFTRTGLPAGGSWTQRTFAQSATWGTPPNALWWSPEFEFFFAAGTGGLLEYSSNGISWTAGTLASSENIYEFVYGGSYVYGVDRSALQIARSPNLTTDPISNSWTTIPVTFGGSSTGIWKAASGNGRVLLIGNSAGGIDIGYITHGSATAVDIGTLTFTGTPGDIVFGNDGTNDVFLIVSEDFSVSKVTAGSELTIGNWAAMSSPKVANVVILQVIYDKGNGVNPGYGFIAVGYDTTGVQEGLIWTSTDGITWSERSRNDVGDDQQIRAIWTQYQLSGAELD